MNSDKPDQVMENKAITSKNKKKSKGKSKTDAALTDVIGRAPKKSFWKSLFRFKKHHDDPGNSSTHVITVDLGVNSEESKTAPIQRLSSIFEETADPATLDPKTIAEDISEIKKTIKRMSETSNPSVIIDKITQNYPVTNAKGAKKRTKDDAFLGYLSDISSASSEDEEDEASEEKLDEQPSPGEYGGITNQDNNSTYTDLLADDKPNNKGSSSLLKEGYSFEYSETSENSNDDVLEEKPEKVTFDTKVETKDANSIIMVRPLDENDSRVVIEEAVDNVLLEKTEFVLNAPQEGGTTSDITEEDIIVARIQDIVSGQYGPSKITENLIMLEEENADTTAATENLDSHNSVPAAQKPQNRTFFSIPPEDVKSEEEGQDGANRFVEESDPSTSSVSKHSTYVHQDLDETLDIESIEEETELWMEDLNDFPFITTPDMVPLEDLDDDTNIDNEIFREFRLNKFFKMIQNNITMNVSIAYDPLFENEPMIQNFHTAIVEQEVRNEERNKVIRKRKMMSLLHDKQVFKDYLKEIEEANVSAPQNVSDSSSKMKATEEEIKETDEDPNITIPIKKASNKLIDMNRVPRGNIFNEATLLNLQTTKNKLEKFLIEENGKKSQANSVYPKQYLRVYNLQTNRLNEDGLEDTNSSMESYSMSSEELIHIESDTTVGKSTSAIFNEEEGEEEIVEQFSPSLQTKICAYETIDRDVEQLITELMGHVSDLKESCIKYGAAVSNDAEDDPVLFTKQADVYNEIHGILNEILENVFILNDDDHDDLLHSIATGHFNQCFSFIREVGHIDEMKTALSYQIKPVIKNYYQTENAVSLTENLQRANGYLSTVYEEMCEYNPIPILGNEDFEENENIQFIDESNMENDEEPIMEQSLLYNENLIDFDYQTDFETELSVIHEEDEPSSSTCDIDYNSNNNSNSTYNTSAKMASIDIAENIIQFIEKSVSEKLSSIQNNYENLQDFDEKTLNIRQTLTEEEIKPSNSDSEMIPEENEATMSSSDVNNTTKHDTSNVKFNSDNDFATASNSRDNKFEPQPGTSKQQANCFIKPDKSSATICSSTYHLPSVPSTELVCTENSSQHSEFDNGIETLLTKKFSELPNSSTEDINPEDLQALMAFQVPSNFSQGATMLERKSPQTNFLELLRNLNVEDTKNLTKIEVDKCIEENLKSFQESIKETIKLNQKTIEMIQSSSSQINTGGETSDVLTIISTLSCNMPEPVQVPVPVPVPLPVPVVVPIPVAKSDDAPQEEEGEKENKASSQSVITTTNTQSESVSESKSKSKPKTSESTSQEQSQEWYGNSFFSKSKTNNSVPKLCQLSEKVYAKSETDNESEKDDTESTFSNHNFDVDTYTDISFEETTGLNRLKMNECETVCQSEFSLDTQYLSCSNFSSRTDGYSGKSRTGSNMEENLTNEKTKQMIDGTGTPTNISSGIKNLMNGDLANKYLEKQFNFGINFSTLINEEFERKAKLNFGEQM